MEFRLARLRTLAGGFRAVLTPIVRRGTPARAAAVCAGLAAAAAIIWFGLPAGVAQSASRETYHRVSSAPVFPVAIVLGAAVFPDGRLSPVLQGRVDAAIALYRAGKVKKLLMSGDNSTSHYDEPTAMKRYAVCHGVPADDVVRDYAGFHTFDTCYRAKRVFGISRAIFVTQAFHLPRCLYLARAMGIDAAGFVAPNNMPPADVRFFERRERAAMIGALIDVATNRVPKYPGPSQPSLMAGSNPGS
jgi:SanA protein